jgi:hypothetical protein
MPGVSGNPAPLIFDCFQPFVRPLLIATLAPGNHVPAGLFQNAKFKGAASSP